MKLDNQKIRSLFTIQNVILLLLLAVVGYQQIQIKTLQDNLQGADAFSLKYSVDDLKHSLKRVESDVAFIKLTGTNDKITSLESRIEALELEAARKPLYVIR